MSSENLIGLLDFDCWAQYVNEKFFGIGKLGKHEFSGVLYFA
jgi:hypothetical protein